MYGYAGRSPARVNPILCIINTVMGGLFARQEISLPNKQFIRTHSNKFCNMTVLVFVYLNLTKRKEPEIEKIYRMKKRERLSIDTVCMAR